MESELKKLTCVPECGFVVVSHDEDEIVEFGVSHVSNIHKGTSTPAEIRQMIVPA